MKNKRLFLILVISILGLVHAKASFAANDYDVVIERAEIPDSLVADQRFKIKLRINNKGSRSLSTSRNVAIQLTSNKRSWRNTQLEFGNQTIKPGQSRAIELTATAPSSADIYQVQLSVVSGNSQISEKTGIKEVTVETRSNYVNFISQVVPENMKANNHYRIIVQYKNKGSHVWTNEDNYRLELYGNQARRWAIKNAKLASNSVVPPGEIATFRIDLTAPKKAGKYELQMRLKKGSRTWFGQPTPPILVKVSRGKQELDAEFLHQAIPGMQKSSQYFSIFQRGKVYPITLTFKNQGTQPWLPGIYKLVALHDKSEFNWSLGQVELKPSEVIQPGQIKSFNFKVISPLTPGIYDFQWQVRKGKTVWVGEPSEPVSITVQ